MTIKKIGQKAINGKGQNFCVVKGASLIMVWITHAENPEERVGLPCAYEVGPGRPEQSEGEIPSKARDAEIK